MEKRPMAETLLPSLLDRLIVDDAQDHFKLSEIKKRLCRDLQNLLNTRCRANTPPDDLEELETSLVNYGLRDFSAANLTSAEQREEFRALVEATVRRFETRLKNVRAALVSHSAAEPGLSLRIQGVFMVELVSEPMAFDSQWQPASGMFDVKSGNV